jgi:hypothetical protein
MDGELTMVRFPPRHTGRKPNAKEMRHRIIERFSKALEYLAR